MEEKKEKRVLSIEPDETVVMQQELSDDELNLAAGGTYRPEILHRHLHDDDDDPPILPTLPN